MLSHLSWLKVPKIHWTLSTDRVLTMEFCSGGFIDDVDYMKRNKIDLVGVSNKISQVCPSFLLLAQSARLYLRTCVLPLTVRDGVAKIFPPTLMPSFLLLAQPEHLFLCTCVARIFAETGNHTHVGSVAPL